MIVKFIYAKNIADFEENYNTISSGSIVFIEETKQIWVQGQFYSCPYSIKELQQLFGDRIIALEKLIIKNGNGDLFLANNGEYKKVSVDLSGLAPLASPSFTGIPQAPTANLETNNAQIATTAFVQNAINTKIATADVMIYKGTIGTNGNVTKLPNTTAKVGWTYRVITAGTYANIKCEVGDIITCITDGSQSTDAVWTTLVTLNTAKTDTIGGIKIAKDNTNYTVAGITSNISSNITSGKYYGVELDKDDKAFVYIPWTDTKVTSVGNHYTPSGGTTTSASGGALTDITNSSSGIQVLTGVTKDAAGHITGVNSVALKSTNTTYSSKSAVSGGTDISLVTTGEKYLWNSKTSNTGTVTSVATGVGLTGGTVTTSGTIKAKLRSETALTVDSAAATTTSGRVYPVAVDKSGYLSVNVPWTDTNTWRGITDSVSTTDSGTSASATAVKTAYDKAVSAYNLANGKTSNTGTVTSVIAGTGLTGGTITTSGTLSVSYGTTAGTACQGNDSRLSNARPASDVYSWAKAQNKPSYSWSEITGKPSTFTPSSHTHTKSQITDFPTSLPASDVYSWAKAASKPSYTINEISYAVGTANTLASLDVTKQVIYATLSAATSISLSGSLAVGKSITILGLPSTSFTQPIPNTGSYTSLDGDYIEVTANKMFEINILCYASGKYSVSCKTSL